MQRSNVAGSTRLWKYCHCVLRCFHRKLHLSGIQYPERCGQCPSVAKQWAYSKGMSSRFCFISLEVLVCSYNVSWEWRMLSTYRHGTKVAINCNSSNIGVTNVLLPFPCPFNIIPDRIRPDLMPSRQKPRRSPHAAGMVQMPHSLSVGAFSSRRVANGWLPTIYMVFVRFWASIRICIPSGKFSVRNASYTHRPPRTSRVGMPGPCRQWHPFPLFRRQTASGEGFWQECGLPFPPACMDCGNNAALPVI